jgi:hypothetical protein
MSNYAAYEKFFSPEQAVPVLAILKEHDVPYEFLKIGKTIDTVIAGESLSYNYELKLAPKQFEYVNTLLLNEIQINLDDMAPDYYLFSFTDKELVEILMQPDEWGRQDYIIARLLLEERGVKYSDEDLAHLKNKRLEVLARPEKDGKNMVYTGYMLAFLGGFFGVLIGLLLWQSTKVLPNGKKVHTYDEKSRKNGRIIVIVALVVFSISLALRWTRFYEYISSISIFERPVVPEMH